MFSFAKGKHALANIFQALKQTGETTRARHSFLERKGDHLRSRWWKVESTLLEQRKTYGCDKYPFYKNLPHPPRTSYL